MINVAVHTVLHNAVHVTYNAVHIAQHSAHNAVHIAQHSAHNAMHNTVHTMQCTTQCTLHSACQQTTAEISEFTAAGSPKNMSRNRQRPNLLQRGRIPPVEQLLCDVADCQTVKTFCRRLKHFLFSFSFPGHLTVFILRDVYHLVSLFFP